MQDFDEQRTVDHHHRHDEGAEMYDQELSPSRSLPGQPAPPGDPSGGNKNEGRRRFLTGGSPSMNKLHAEARARTDAQNSVTTRMSIREAELTDNEEGWLVVAMEECPQFTKAEIRNIRALFETYARVSAEGQKMVLNQDALSEILFDSMKLMFKEIDVDGSGTLDRSEVSQLVGKLNRPMSTEELDEVMSQLDEDGDGCCDFNEFKEWNQKDTAAELNDMFAQVDDDFSGEIDWPEFVTALAKNVLHIDSRTSVSIVKDDSQPREAVVLVRCALESVRQDIRAIYGSASYGKPRLQVQTEEEREAANRCCFFRPEGTGWGVQFRKAWDITQVGVLLYVAIMVPLRIGFRLDPLTPCDAMFWLELCVDIYFWFDIVLNFRTAYRDDSTGHALLVVDLKLIRNKYLKSWFSVDIVSCLPITYVDLLLGSGTCGGNRQSTDIKILKVLRLMRIAKLLRLARIKRLIERLEDEYEGIAQVTRMTKIVMSIIFTAHFVACFWFFVGSCEIDQHDKCVLSMGNGTSILHSNDVWTPHAFERVCCEDAHTRGKNFGWVHFRDWTQDTPLTTAYLDAFYYSVTTLTTVGYGDRIPTTNIEILFAIVAELAGCVIFGIVAGSLGSLAMSTTMSEREKKYQREQLREFLRAKGIGSQQQHQVLEQMENWWQKKSVFDERQLLDKLPPKHRKELLMKMYRPSIMNSPLLKGVDDGILTKLCIQMRPYAAISGDVVVQEGEVGEEMFMVVSGIIKLKSTRYPLYQKRTWSDGAFFGELSILGLGGGVQKNRHVYSVESVGDSDMTFLTMAGLKQLFAHKLSAVGKSNHFDDDDCPTLEDRMRDLAIQRATRFGHFADTVANAQDVEKDAVTSPTNVATVQSTTSMVQTHSMGSPVPQSSDSPPLGISAELRGLKTLSEDVRLLSERMTAETHQLRLCAHPDAHASYVAFFYSNVFSVAADLWMKPIKRC